MTAPSFAIDRSQAPARVSLRGRWTIHHAATLDDLLNELGELARAEPLAIDTAAVDSFDLSGAWLLLRAVERWQQSQRVTLERSGLADLDYLQRLQPQQPPAAPAPVPGWRAHLESLGRGGVDLLGEARHAVDFLGRVVVALARTVWRPRRWRVNEVAGLLYKTGVQGLLIVGLIAFLISIVVAYQGAVQLREFGADIYTVDLLAVSILREMGVLLTAIMVAGRSGSAFAAQLGVMKMNEEVAALQTMGVSPMEVLVLPRVLALTLAMPLLTVFANIIGLAGGALFCVLLLDIPLQSFVSRLWEVIVPSTFLVGIIKAPVFGFIIAVVGCRRGFQVTGSADEVGRYTTMAVVEAIFLVIVLDAIFSVVFLKLDW